MLTQGSLVNFLNNTPPRTILVQGLCKLMTLVVFEVCLPDICKLTPAISDNACTKQFDFFTLQRSQFCVWAAMLFKYNETHYRYPNGDM